MLQKQSLNSPEYIFRDEICKSLPRVLSLIETDKTSPSYGMGDRYHWAWGLIDFGNGTFQGLANGFSRLWISGLWPYPTSTEKFIEKINAFFHGAKNLTRQDGSLEEAFPNEGSYCVTALVAYDLLVTIELLHDLINEELKNEWLKIVSPMIRFLVQADETHALISNHLATAVAALVRWVKLVGGDQNETSKADVLLERILRNQSDEGWFKEYEGPDPGYQSLCTYYLADVHLNRKDFNLLDPLRQSVQFLWHFAHPDGSFGGHYGSRSTRFFYPGGLLALSEEIPEAHSLSEFMAESISEQRVVGLAGMDEPNLAPMFNSYAWAASLETKSPLQNTTALQDRILPCKAKQPFRKNFTEAGLLVDRGADHYTVLNYKKGGVVQHYLGDKLNHVDTGIVIQAPNQKLGSNQFHDSEQNIELNDSKIVIRSQIAEMPKKLSSPVEFLILRILCLTVFRFSSIREFVKRMLVASLITKPKLWPIWNKREIYFGKDLRIEDVHEMPRGYKSLKQTCPFVTIHMASKGYWQVQDEEPNT